MCVYIYTTRREREKKKGAVEKYAGLSVAGGIGIYIHIWLQF
jgi:hypothetical protein